MSKGDLATKFDWTIAILVKHPAIPIVFFIGLAWSLAIIIRGTVSPFVEMAPYLFACLYVVLDLVGYEAVKITESHMEVREEQKNDFFLHRQSHRIIQHLFLYAICFLGALVPSFGWKFPAIILTILFTGGLDYLYELFGNYNVVRYDDGTLIERSWLRWTVVGWFKKIIMPGLYITQFVIGYIASIIITLWGIL
jgi:hypothetical protein